MIDISSSKDGMDLQNLQYDEFGQIADPVQAGIIYNQSARLGYQQYQNSLYNMGLYNPASDTYAEVARRVGDKPYINTLADTIGGLITGKGLSDSASGSDVYDTTSKGGGGYGGGGHPSTGTTYLDAPYAEAYGMSAETAYQEALAGSAHQREVQDLIKAGLNPVLSVTKGNGASTFSGSDGSAGGGSSAADEDSSVNDFISGAGQVIGDIITLATGKSAYGNAAGRILSTLGTSGAKLLAAAKSS